MVISGLVVAAVLGFMTSNLSTSAVETARAELLSEAHIGLDRTANDIRLSTSADDNNRWQDNNAPGAPSNTLSWQSDGDTLVLATSAEDASGNILFEDALDYITVKNNIIYFAQNGTLYKRILAAPAAGNSAKTTCPAASASSSCPADTVVLQNVTSFSVKYINGQNQQVTPTNARSIELSVTVSRTRFGRPITADYTTRMVFRNG
jgi:hypothetical protein